MHVKGDASAARTRWKEFVDESLAGGGRGAHAISKKPHGEAKPILADGSGDSSPVPLVGQAALDQMLVEWKALWSSGDAQQT
eukprot:7829334-Pyramimonas_sp.AAC.1